MESKAGGMESMAVGIKSMTVSRESMFCGTDLWIHTLWSGKGKRQGKAVKYLILMTKMTKVPYIF